MPLPLAAPGTALTATQAKAWGHIAPPYRTPAHPRSVPPTEAKPPVSAPVTAAPVLANDVSSRFGRRLRQMRLSRNLTQSDMARKFGIDRSFISELECGRKAVSLPMLEVIALGMQISLSELFKDL